MLFNSVEAIVTRVDPETLQHLYNVPPYRNAAEFLTMVALSRGRLGKVRLNNNPCLQPLHSNAYSC